VLFTIGPPGLECARAWAEKHGSSAEDLIRSKQGQIALAPLYTYWAKSAGRRSFWRDLPRPDAKGTLPEQPDAAKEFRDWVLRTKARVMTEAPLVDAAGPQPRRTEPIVPLATPVP
jgi:hypothetical protein